MEGGEDAVGVFNRDAGAGEFNDGDMSSILLKAYFCRPPLQRSPRSDRVPLARASSSD